MNIYLKFTFSEVYVTANVILQEQYSHIVQVVCTVLSDISRQREKMSLENVYTIRNEAKKNNSGVICEYDTLGEFGSDNYNIFCVLWTGKSIKVNLDSL